MNAILKLKHRKIDNHIRHFAKSGDLVEVIRYLSPNWATIQITNSHTWVVDVPSDVLEVERCEECEKETVHTITRCKKCGDNDAI